MSGAAGLRNRSRGSTCTDRPSAALQLFYYTHLVGAVLFMVFGAMHHRNTWLYAAAGLVIYGIDVAYRLYQTSLPVTVDVSSSSSTNIITIRVPVQVRPPTTASSALKSSLGSAACVIYVFYSFLDAAVTETPAMPLC